MKKPPRRKLELRRDSVIEFPPKPFYVVALTREANFTVFTMITLSLRTQLKQHNRALFVAHPLPGVVIATFGHD